MNVAGFLEPGDIEADDIDLWMPCKSKLSVFDGQYLVTHLKEFFACLLRHDTSLNLSESSEVESGSVSLVFLYLFAILRSQIVFVTQLVSAAFIVQL